MKNQLLYFTKYFLPAIIWAAIIFTISHQEKLPGPDSGVLNYLLKKTGHLVVYLILFLLTYRGLSRGTSLPHSKLAAFLICVLYALTDEYHQSFVPGRFPSLIDVGYDSFGASLAWLSTYFRPFQKNPSTN
jgi:VanZ family protein